MKTKTYFPKVSLFTLLIILAFCIVNIKAKTQSIKTPENFFGFEPGADYELFNYESLIKYLQLIDEQSDRLKLLQIGETELGKKMYIAFISSPENIKNLDSLKLINKDLAVNPNLSEKIYQQHIKNGKVFFLATLSMHSSEVGPSQSAPAIAYELTSTNNEEILQWLEEVVYMMIPCHNPDGMDMIVDHYNKYKETKYEKSSMPGLYHKYVGHDNNRDFINLSQKETKSISNIYSKEWFPQVMIEKHQMGKTGVRYFIPPNHDPISENLDEELWSWTWVFGSNMLKDMTEKGLKGVAQHYLFDNYWPGSTETSNWKNVVSLLSEAASVWHASPVFVEKNELNVYGKGLAEYAKSINFTAPWDGGWWRLSDIVEYEKQSTYSIIKTSSHFRKELLKMQHNLCLKETNKGRNEAPYYYLFPAEQHDKSETINLINLMLEHGVNIFQLKDDFSNESITYSKGSYVIPLAQPFRPFIKEVLEKQSFPERHYTPEGDLITPYDITTWSLPLHMGVKVIQIDKKLSLNECIIEIEKIKPKPIVKDSTYIILPPTNNESFKLAFKALFAGKKVYRLAKPVQQKKETYPAGSFVLKKSAISVLENSFVSPHFANDLDKKDFIKIEKPNIALVESYFHDMDAGWTRHIFDQYNIPFTLLRPHELKNKKKIENIDVLIFPDENKSLLKSGKYKSDNGKESIPNYPPEYVKGMEKDGMQNIASFLNDGGIIISWRRSTALFMETLKLDSTKNDVSEEFKLPINDVSKKLAAKGFKCYGSFLKTNVIKDHPLTWGMPETTGVFHRSSPVFKTNLPTMDMDRRVIVSFSEDNTLLSGYCKEEKLLKNKPAMVWIKKGKGQLILYSFNPQFRASTSTTYKLLFNSLMLQKN